MHRQTATQAFESSADEHIHSQCVNLLNYLMITKLQFLLYIIYYYYSY